MDADVEVLLALIDKNNTYAVVSKRVKEVLIAAEDAQRLGQDDLALEAIHTARTLIRGITEPEINSLPGKVGIHILLDVLMELGGRPAGALLLASIFIEGMEKGARKGFQELHKKASELTEENNLLKSKIIAKMEGTKSWD